jgi:hypothetical protein
MVFEQDTSTAAITEYARALQGGSLIQQEVEPDCYREEDQLARWFSWYAETPPAQDLIVMQFAGCILCESKVLVLPLVRDDALMSFARKLSCLCM